MEKEKSSLQTWAENEVKLYIKSNSDEYDEYVALCAESALRAFNSLANDSHSGCSIQITKNILNRLIDHLPLTPIPEDVEWEEAWNDTDGVHYQCSRESSLFKHVKYDGTVTYSDNRILCREIDSQCFYHNSFITKIISKMFPITFPYIPNTKSYNVYTKDSLYAIGSGNDYDTIAIFYVITPDDERIEINRFFKEGRNDLVEITKEEYDDRIANPIHVTRIRSSHDKTPSIQVEETSEGETNANCQ